MATEQFRIGQAAKMLDVRVETIRRWDRAGRLRTTRTAGGHRRIAAEDVAKLAAERSRRLPDRAAGSDGVYAVVVSVREDDVVAVLEIVAGPHRIVALTTREAVDALSLEPGTALSASNAGGPSG